MTFHELLEKYKSGTITEEEKRLVEDELEKNEAISDYLAESINDEFIEREAIKNGSNYIKKIKRTVNKKLVKVIAVSVSIVFIIILGTKYIISPLVASNYYDPEKHSLADYSSDIFFDYRTITELLYPGYSALHANASSNGFGCYSYILYRKNIFSGESTVYSGEINRNKNIGIYSDTISTNRDYILGMWAQSRNSDDLKKHLEVDAALTNNRLEDLKKLPSSSYISAYIYPNNDIPVEELIYHQMDYNLEFIWAGVRVSDNTDGQFLGFRPTVNYDSSSGNSEEYYDKYPLLALSDFYSINKNYYGSVPWEVTGYEQHFKVMLNYIKDRTDAVNTLVPYPLDADSYLSYIDKNGVNCYALLVFGEVDEVLRFYEEQNALSIYVNNVLPSKYSNPNYN